MRRAWSLAVAGTLLAALVWAALLIRPVQPHDGWSGTYLQDHASLVAQVREHMMIELDALLRMQASHVSPEELERQRSDWRETLASRMSRAYLGDGAAQFEDLRLDIRCDGTWKLSGSGHWADRVDLGGTWKEPSQGALLELVVRDERYLDHHGPVTWHKRGAIDPLLMERQADGSLRCISGLSLLAPMPWITEGAMPEVVVSPRFARAALAREP